MLIEMKKIKIAEDDVFKTPIIILESDDKKYIVPIWVGPFEGQAIEYGLKGKQLLRPLPYDTILKILKTFDIQLKKVIINEFTNNTFYAVLKLNKKGESFEIDSRSSDAIVLAVREGCKIFISEEVIEKTSTINTSNFSEKKSSDIDNKDDVKSFWDNLKPEDFNL